MTLDGSDPRSIERAAMCLAAGELVALPTETVYGLGARADDAAAVARIFALKGRPSDHPLIVHVDSPAQASLFAAEIPVVAQRLMAAFWPGALTVILRRLPGVADAAAGGQDTIGLRCPSHPVAQALLREARQRGVPGVAAPSANRFGRVSPTRADHVQSEFGEAVLVLDGGDCDLGIESTIVDCSTGHPVLLRPGMVTRDAVAAAAGEPVRDPGAQAPRAPGTLAAHYAPNATLRLWSPEGLHTALQELGEPSQRLAVYSRESPPARAGGVRHRRMPDRPDQVAHELFSVLRELDAGGAQLIWVEEPPPGAEWDGVRDRLRRAAAA